MRQTLVEREKFVVALSLIVHLNIFNLKISTLCMVLFEDAGCGHAGGGEEESALYIRTTVPTVVAYRYLAMFPSFGLF